MDFQLFHNVGGNKKFHNGRNGFLIEYEMSKFKLKIEKFINLNNRKNFEKNSFNI